MKHPREIVMRIFLRVPVAAYFTQSKHVAVKEVSAKFVQKVLFQEVLSFQEI